MCGWIGLVPVMGCRSWGWGVEHWGRRARSGRPAGTKRFRPRLIVPNSVGLVPANGHAITWEGGGAEGGAGGRPRTDRRREGCRVDDEGRRGRGFFSGCRPSSSAGACGPFMLPVIARTISSNQLISSVARGRPLGVSFVLLTSGRATSSGSPRHTRGPSCYDTQTTKSPGESALVHHFTVWNLVNTNFGGGQDR